MRRREFITLLGGATVAWPVAARAQQSAKVSRFGFLVARPLQDSRSAYDSFVRGMRELGYFEGKDFVSELRSAEGRYEQAPELAAELVRLKVDVLFTGFGAGVRALQEATRTIPIVFVLISDPIGQGFVASFPHPGGNTTGLAGSFDDTLPKRLELLAAVAPGASRFGLLYNPESSSFEQATAQRAGLSLVLSEARDLEGNASPSSRLRAVSPRSPRNWNTWHRESIRGLREGGRAGGDGRGRRFPH
jgi:putative ABC transport system substrate-binding protein